MTERELREELVKWGKKIITRGLVVGAGGNISARYQDVMLISPSGLAFDEIPPEGFIPVSLETGKTLGTGRPSSEVVMHWYCYLQRPDIQAVIHTHPPLTIGVIGGGGKIEAMFPDFVAYLGTLGMVDYMTPCTPTLASAVQKQIADKNGVLLIGHGALTVGNNLKEAFQRTEIIEESARILMTAKMFGEPRILTATECEAIQQLDAEKYRMQLLKESK
ncbi:MAG: class II aldolase/adducin family protein [Atribacterota bacterium]|nr:class II aldolase/adducin family protein [Candidatus Atribacteria bacterium]